VFVNDYFVAVYLHKPYWPIRMNPLNYGTRPIVERSLDPINTTAHYASNAIESARQERRGEREENIAMLTHYPAYSVLLCREHRCAVYGLDKHLERHHHIRAAERRALLASYEDFALVTPGEVAQPAPYSSPKIYEQFQCTFNGILSQ
jgi:hypothetical protein